MTYSLWTKGSYISNNVLRWNSCAKSVIGLGLRDVSLRTVRKDTGDKSVLSSTQK